METTTTTSVQDDGFTVVKYKNSRLNKRTQSPLWMPVTHALVTITVAMLKLIFVSKEEYLDKVKKMHSHHARNTARLFFKYNKRRHTTQEWKIISLHAKYLVNKELLHRIARKTTLPKSTPPKLAAKIYCSINKSYANALRSNKGQQKQQQQQPPVQPSQPQIPHNSESETLIAQLRATIAERDVTIDLLTKEVKKLTSRVELLVERLEEQQSDLQTVQTQQSAQIEKLEEQVFQAQNPLSQCSHGASRGALLFCNECTESLPAPDSSTHHRIRKLIENPGKSIFPSNLVGFEMGDGMSSILSELEKKGETLRVL